MTTIVQTQGPIRSLAVSRMLNRREPHPKPAWIPGLGPDLLRRGLPGPGLDTERVQPVRDEWSLLALGHPGWIQQVNLVMTGAMTIAGAIGVRRALSRSAGAGPWGPRLLTGYGVALISAGIFAPIPPMGSRPALPAALRACGRLSRRRSRIHCRLRRDCNRSDERSDQPGLHGCRRC
jgi:hypothetical protein